MRAIWAPVLVALLTALATPVRGSELACPSPPPPIAGVSTKGVYSDPQHSIVDPEKLKVHRLKIKPLHDYLNFIADLADSTDLSKTPPGECNCVVRSLDTWAVRNALSESTATGATRWTVTALAGAYLRSKPGPGVCQKPQDHIESWLQELDLKNVPGEFSGRRRLRSNNIDYWGGAGAALVYLATGKAKSGWDFAIAAYRNAMDTLTADNLLPNELRRGQRKWNYHFFALTPLTVIAEVGKACGVDLYGYNGGRIFSVINAALQGFRSSLASADQNSFDSAFQQLPDNQRVWINFVLQENPGSLPENLRNAGAERTSFLGGRVDRLISAIKAGRGKCH